MKITSKEIQTQRILLGIIGGSMVITALVLDISSHELAKIKKAQKALDACVSRECSTTTDNRRFKDLEEDIGRTVEYSAMVGNENYKLVCGIARNNMGECYLQTNSIAPNNDKIKITSYSYQSCKPTLASCILDAKK